MYLCNSKNEYSLKLFIMKKIFTLFAALFVVAFTFAQLPDGSIAPDFTLYEINKTTGDMMTDHTINLYSMLNEYKTVYIDVSATTCGPCYNFHHGGTLETIWNNYGPNSSVDDSRVLFIEGAQTGNSWAAINGSAGSSYWDCTHVYGSTTELVPYPVIPLCLAPNYPSNYNSFHSGYSIGYFPTIYMVCPNRQIYCFQNPGTTNSATTFHNQIASKCPTWTNTNDASLISDKIAENVYYCNADFQPQILVQNMGTAPMTSLTLQVTHGTDVQTTTWTGNVAQFETELVTLPAITGSQDGQHTLTVQIMDVNGQPDEGAQMNTHTETFNVQGSSTIDNALQYFSSSNLGAWTLIDNTGGNFGISQGALRLRAWSASSGTTGECYAPLFNFSNATTPSLKFDYAHRRYSSASEKLQVMVSSDCGETWTTVWEKSGADLATVTSGSGEFTPTASQYKRDEKVSLSDYAGMSSVIVKFVFTSGYGNNVYVDNIEIANSPLDVEEVDESSLAIFPNPVKDVLNINYDKAISQIDVYDVNGKLVKTLTTVGSSINVSDLSDGIYMLNIQTEEGLVIRKIVKE